MYTSTASRERRESAEDGEDEDEEEEEEGREEEEEQRPLCSAAVLGYPVVRDHALGLSAANAAASAQAENDVQEQTYKGDDANMLLVSPKRKNKTVFILLFRVTGFEVRKGLFSPDILIHTNSVLICPKQ